MKSLGLTTSAVLLLGSTALSAPELDDAELIAHAGALYQKNCMGCHQAPDLRFETDRAWVGQIMETA